MSPRTSPRTTTVAARQSIAALCTPPGIQAMPSASVSASALRKRSAGPRRLPGLRKARHRRLPKIDWQFTFAMTTSFDCRRPLGAAA